MADVQVTVAVEARLGETWDGIPVFGVNSNKGRPPSDGSPFLMVQYPVVTDRRRMAVNAPIYREEGGFRLVLNETRGIGLQQGMERSKRLDDLFRDQKFAGVTCQVPSSPLIDDDNEDGNYFQLSMVVPYTFNF